MKKITMKKGAAVSTLALLLTACGSPSSQGDEPLMGAAFGQGQTESATNTNYIAITDEELGDLANVPDTETASLQVMDDFTFDTSRRTSVSMSVPDAIANDAEASFCTDYSVNSSGGYDINYDSCVLSAPLVGGEINEDLNLVNQHASVVGVVWFQDSAMMPVYQEFHFD